MSSSVRSGLVCGIGLAVIGFVSTIMCQLCGPLNALAGGAMAGLLSQRWGVTEQDSPAAIQGAIAGGIAGIGAMIGQLGSTALNTWMFISQRTLSDLAEQMLGAPIGPADIVVSASMWALVAIVGIGLAVAAGASAGHMGRRNRMPDPRIFI